MQKVDTVDTLQSIQKYFRQNKMLSTLSVFRSEMLNKVPRAPSIQFINTLQKCLQSPTSHHKNQLILSVNPKKWGQESQKKKNAQEEQLAVEGLLGKLAYSGKLLKDIKLNEKVGKMMDRPVFWKALTKMFPQTAQKAPKIDLGLNIQQENPIFYNIQSKNTEFLEQAEIAIDPTVNTNKDKKENTKNKNSNNIFEQKIPMGNDNSEEPSNILDWQILSLGRPSDQKDEQLDPIDDLKHKETLIAELNKLQSEEQYIEHEIQDIDDNIGSVELHKSQDMIIDMDDKQQVIDEYTDDHDVGYHEFLFNELLVIDQCSKLKQKYNYPDRALKPNTSKQLLYEKFVKSRDKKRLPKQAKFQFQDQTALDKQQGKFPLEYQGTIYDMYKIRVIFNRQKTGFEEFRKIKIEKGDIVGGRYLIEKKLGNGVFAKVYKALDLLKNKQSTCLKMIINEREKDFIDQGFDEIKILRYINCNVNADENSLLTFKDAFYYREHLFIETDLMEDNLYSAYRKNPYFFTIDNIRIIGQQILKGLIVLNKLHIIHSDLKPQNILIKSYDPLQVKIVDFGNSFFFHDQLGEYVQSRSYRAPEVLLGLAYGNKIDIWSLGCILAQLLTKNVLFYNCHVQGMIARIQGIVGPWPQWMINQGNNVQLYFSKENLIYFEQAQFFHILVPKNTTLQDRIRTDNFKFVQFLKQMLEIDPFVRISAQQALFHPFIIGEE